MYPVIILQMIEWMSNVSLYRWPVVATSEISAAPLRLILNIMWFKILHNEEYIWVYIPNKEDDDD